MWNHIRDNIMQLFCDHPSVQRYIPELEEQVSKQHMTPGFAADILLQKFAKSFVRQDSPR